MPLICFASPKGGVGKTTLAANVACELAKGGFRVVALDLDPQNALRLHFGLPFNENRGFMHMLPQRPNWRNAVCLTSSGVHLLPFGTTDFQRANSVSKQLGDNPDLLSRPLADMLAQPDVVVIVDAEPGPSPSLAAVLPLADLLISILLVDSMSTALVPAIDTGRAYGLDFTRRNAADGPQRHAFIFNQFDPLTRLGPALAAGLSRHVGRKLLGLVHRDENIAEAIAAQKMVRDYAPAAQAAFDIRQIAQGIGTRLGDTSHMRSTRRAVH